MKHEIIINQEDDSVRIDKFLCKKFDISFSLAQKIIREKGVKINNSKTDPSYKIKEGDNVKIFIDLNNRFEKIKKVPKISQAKIKDFLNRIIYKDENLIAINKPSGLATQGGSGIDISVNDLLFSLKNDPKDDNPQLVHRLDKDTSGILLIALNKQMASFLIDGFKNKTIKKTYQALVFGNLEKNEGIINIALRKKFVGKNEKVYPDYEFGKEAITKFKLIKNFENYAWLKLMPITGRTHQLRVHCKEIGHPIINDIKYGGTKVFRSDLSEDLCLCATKIEVKNYFGSNNNLIIEIDQKLNFLP